MRGGRGFTMIEFLITMGMFTIVAGIALFINMQSYRASNFRTDRDLLIATLQRARSQAISNICLGTCSGNDGLKHGVAIRPSDHPGAFVIFQTTSDYASRGATNSAVDTVIVASSSQATGIASVVFDQLSGNVSSVTSAVCPVGTPRCIVLTGDGHVSTTTISSDGQITWTN